MKYIPLLAIPYQTLIQPIEFPLMTVFLMIGGILIGLDWIRPAVSRTKGRLTVLITIFSLIAIQREFLPFQTVPAKWILAGGALLVLFYLVKFADRSDFWQTSGRLMPAWIGLVVITLLFGLKSLELESFPPFLKSYSGNTGMVAVHAVNGQWPPEFFQGKGYDLQSGGESPLMLPLMVVIMTVFGINVFSVCFSEVIGSTILLVFFWLWIRWCIPGYWSLIALIVFAISPWHLAQSRMGTFLSISAALGMAILYFSENISRHPKSHWVRWAALGLCVGLIGYAYAPAKVLYPFSILVFLVDGFKCIKASPRQFLAPLTGLIILGVVITIQLQGLPHLGHMFRSDFGVLATDNAIWHKTPDGVVTKEFQPLSLIMRNLEINIRDFLILLFRDKKPILVFYPYAVIGGLIISIVAMIKRWSWVGPMYYIFGLMPMLIVFPEPRRNFIMWPLVYVAGVLAFRELTFSMASLFPHIAWRRAAHAMTLSLLIIILLQGLHIFVKTNSMVGMYDYFGPAMRLSLVDEARNLLPTHQVVIVNPWVHVDSIEIPLYEPGRRYGPMPRYRFANIGQRTPDESVMEFQPQDLPVCFIFFNMENTNAWLKDKFHHLFPWGYLVERFDPFKPHEVLYWLYFVPLQRG